MQIDISYDKKHGYSASIKELHTHTQAKTRDELIANIHEAVECTMEAEKKIKTQKKKLVNYSFYLNMPNIYAN